MAWLNIDEAIFYSLVWTMAFLSSLFGTLNSADNKPIGKCLFIGAVSGFLAFSAISILVGRLNEPVSGHWYYLGISSLIGLGAKFQDQMLANLLRKMKLLSNDKGDTT